MFGFVRLFLVFYTSSLCDSCRLAGGLFFRFFPVPASGSPDGDAVDFDITVDQLRVDEIRALGIDFDDHIWRLYLKAAGIVDIGHHEGGGFTGSGIETLVEDLHAVIGYTTAGKNGFYFIFI